MEDKIKFIKTILSRKILENNPNDFLNLKLIDCSVELPTNLDGFLSTIFLVKFHLQIDEDNEPSTSGNGVTIKEFIVKINKFSPADRETSNICDQFENEIFTYANIIPYYNAMLCKVNASYRMTDLVPKIYFAANDHFPELSPVKETILVMENLRTDKFRLGPRLHLDQPHLFHMAKAIGRYHSFTYAMRLAKDTKLIEFLSKINPASFLDKNGEVGEYNYLYVIGFERLFNYLDRKPKHMQKNKFARDIELLKTKYWKKPYELLERLRIGCNEDYAVILHGDYLRNNVMFQYKEDLGFDNPEAIKIFDFQEMRYGSPALDLSLFMFFNMSEEQYQTMWIGILRCYHDALTESLCELLRWDRNDKRLERYNYDNIIEHFTKFALYGALVSIHFIPWMTVSEEECQLLAKLCTEDLKGKEFKEITLYGGGDDTNEIITAVAKHASKMGYFDSWY